MMPDLHHSDYSMTMYALPESTKKRSLKQVPGPPKIRHHSAGLVLNNDVTSLHARI